MPKRRKSATGVLLVALAALVSLLAAPTADAAQIVSVRTVMFSTVQVPPVWVWDDEGVGTGLRPVGATLSIIYICPEGSDLDLPFLKSLDWARNSTRASGFRFLSREWWPRGMVTRWRVTSNTDGQIRQTIACRERVSAQTNEHISPFSVTLRLWGPVRSSATLHTETGFLVVRGQQYVPHDVIRLRATKNTLAASARIEQFDNDAFYGDGLVTRSYPAGRYAETKFSTGVRTPGQNCITCSQS